jgi:hypothetical protein
MKLKGNSLPHKPQALFESPFIFILSGERPSKLYLFYVYSYGISCYVALE